VSLTLCSSLCLRFSEDYLADYAFADDELELKIVWYRSS